MYELEQVHTPEPKSAVLSRLQFNTILNRYIKSNCQFCPLQVLMIAISLNTEQNSILFQYCSSTATFVTRSQLRGCISGKITVCFLSKNSKTKKAFEQIKPELRFLAVSGNSSRCFRSPLCQIFLCFFYRMMETGQFFVSFFRQGFWRKMLSLNIGLSLDGVSHKEQYADVIIPNFSQPDLYPATRAAHFCKRKIEIDRQFVLFNYVKKL